MLISNFFFCCRVLIVDHLPFNTKRVIPTLCGLTMVNRSKLVVLFIGTTGGDKPHVSKDNFSPQQVERHIYGIYST